MVEIMVARLGETDASVHEGTFGQIYTPSAVELTENFLLSESLQSPAVFVSIMRAVGHRLAC